MAQLIIEEGGGRREYTLDESTVVIGRDVNCEIPIRDSMSSRRHCEVRREGGGWVLEDLQSSNGTDLNGQAARQAPLAHGDVIRIGEVRIRFLDEAVASEETPVPAVRPVRPESPPKASPVRPVQSVRSAAPSAEEAAPSGVTLMVVGGPQEGTEVEIDTVPFTLGRKAHNSFAIADRRVSGEHARIVREDGVWIIEDLDSGNGLVVGGRRAKRLRMVNGQEIAIGDTVISFRGLPAVSKPERASAKGARAASATMVDEFADASQRISIEVEAPGRFHAVASIGFLASLLAIFYFGFVFVSDYVKSRLPSIDANNRLGEYSSFEAIDDGGKPVGWSLDPDGDPAELRSVEDGAPHGQRALSVSSAGGTDRGFVRVMSETVPVSADREFELSAAMRNQGFVGVGVGVQWIGQTGGAVVGESYTRLLGDRREYSTVEARVRPPEAQGVSQARVVLFGWGSGDFEVDHVELLELDDQTEPAPTLAYRPSEDGQNLEFSFTDRATFSVRGERDLLVREARLAGPSDGEGRFPFGQLIATAKKPVLDEATSTVRSSFALPSTGRERLAYQLLARSSADGLNFSYQKLSGPEGRPRLLVEITDSVAGLPLNIYQDGVLQGSSDRLDATAPATGSEWVVGSRQRQLNVTFSVPTRGALLPAELSRGVKTLVFEPAVDVPNGIWDLAFSSVSRREAERIRTAFAEATGAREDQEYGRAIEILEQLRQDFSWKPELGQRIASEVAKIVGEGERRLEELEAIRIDFERHQAEPIFRNYLARCEEIATQYEGTAVGERANAMLSRISADRSAAVRMVEAKDAKDVLKQAQSFFDGHHNNLARLYAERVLTLAPENDVERQAQQLIRLVEARNLER